MSYIVRLQEDCTAWVTDAFGSECATNTKERALRVLEEAVELAQSLDVTKEEAERVLNRTFTREVGETAQEVAGLQFTLMVLALRLGLNPVVECIRELTRVRGIPLSHFRNKHANKLAAGTAVA